MSDNCINIFDIQDKKDLFISIISKTLKNSTKNIAIINKNACYFAYKLKKVQVFVVFMRDLEFQVKKTTQLEIRSNSVILKKYHDFFNIFSKENLDILLFYQKY